MKEFNYYEFIGVLILGAILLYGISLIFTNIGPVLFIPNLSIGGFGLFFVLSFAFGHLVHALGNGLEYIWWKIFGGMPTDWIRTGKFDFLGKKIRETIELRVRNHIRMPNFAFKKINPTEWNSIVGRIYAAVEGKGKGRRVDIFNNNYSLFRGMATTFLCLAGITVANSPKNWLWALGYLIASLVAIYRMNRFGKYYAREVFIQFLEIKI
jgi:hypothetical protein